MAVNLANFSHSIFHFQLTHQRYLPVQSRQRFCCPSALMNSGDELRAKFMEFPYVSGPHRNLMVELLSTVENRLGSSLQPCTLPSDIQQFENASGTARAAMHLRSGLPSSQDAKEKLRQLQKVISILGDEEKRAVYDQTGCVDDADLAGDAVQNLQTFFRTMYKKISEADIEEFEANYRGSDSEKKDLLDLYNRCKGNMDRLFCCMLCSDPFLDSHRFKDIIDESISSGELKSTKAYEKWAKKVLKTKPPTNPRKRKMSNKNSDLYAIIAQRQSERRGKMDSMFSTLVQKYGGGEAGPEPSEEEFEAARRKLESKRTSKRKR